MLKNNQEKNRKLWEDKWSYQEGFMIAFALLIVGLAIEWANGLTPLPSLSYPTNIIVGAFYISSLLAFYFLFKESRLVNFMKSIPAAVTSVSFFAMNALLMGMFLQSEGNEGIVGVLSLHDVTNSWYFLFSNLFLLTSLGLLLLDKIVHFKIKELGIFISHLGLWLVIFAGSMGSFEMNRLEINLIEGEINGVAINKKTNSSIEMPFALYLKDFRLEEYAPKIGIVDNKSGKLLHEQGKNIRILGSDSAFSVMKWQIQILEYIDFAGKAGDQYYFYNEVGSSPAAKIQAWSSYTDTIIGWISCGSFSMSYQSLKLDVNHSLIMLFPEPKNYISEVELYTREGKQADFTLEVNKPYRWDDWEIYQLSYDDEFGKWSDSSTIELVKDPWLPVVYLGIFLMIAGALYLFWFGRRG